MNATNLFVHLTADCFQFHRSGWSHRLDRRARQIRFFLLPQGDEHLIDEARSHAAHLLHDVTRYIGVERNAQQVKRRLNACEVVEFGIIVAENERL